MFALFVYENFSLDLDEYLVHCLSERIGMRRVGVFGLRHWAMCCYGHNVVIRKGTPKFGQICTEEGPCLF